MDLILDKIMKQIEWKLDLDNHIVYQQQFEAKLY
jgi:hypothetical protein